MLRLLPMLPLLLCLVACGSQPEVPEEVPEEVEASDLDALRALGYLEIAEERVDPSQAAVAAYDPAHPQPGLTMITTMTLALAQLIDLNGEVVRSWHQPGTRRLARAELTEEGDVLLVADKGRLIRLSWDSDLLWEVPGRFHHDVEVTPDGRIASLAHRQREVEAYPQLVTDDEIVLLTSDGRELGRHSVYDMLAASPDVFRFQNIEPVSKEDEAPVIDLLHSNSVEFMGDSKLAERDPIYAPGNVLVSMRHQDSAVIFDLSAGRAVWAWGQGKVSGPHDATLLESGNILLFDNGLGRGWSRVIEIDPLTREVVWEFRAPDPKRFYSGSRGSSQRLPNGNTLVANSNSGAAFEVTADGQLVWQWRNPLAGPKGGRRTIIRAVRYPSSIAERAEASGGGGEPSPIEK